MVLSISLGPERRMPRHFGPCIAEEGAASQRSCPEQFDHTAHTTQPRRQENIFLPIMVLFTLVPVRYIHSFSKQAPRPCI